MENTLTFLDFVLVFASWKWYDKALRLGLPPSCAAVRFNRFLYFIPHVPHIPSLSSLSCSKPVMWAPRLSCHGPSRDQRRWCWTWRWSRSTTSSTSEAAPSYVWRYLSQSTRSERPKWTSSPQRIKLHSSAAHHIFLCFFFLLIIMSSSIKTSPIKTQISWWESIPVLESPPWFNGHWAFMAVIWTFDTEGYLWCTISDILYLEKDLKMMGIILTEYQCIHNRVFMCVPQLSVNFHPFR